MSSVSPPLRAVVALKVRDDIDRLVREALRSEAAVSSYGIWDEFQRAAARADCAIMPIVQFEPELTYHMRELEQAAPDIPLVFIIREGLESLTPAVGLESGAAELLSLNAVATGLPAAMARALERTWLRRVARNAERTNKVSPILANAIAAACRSRRPVRTLDDLAALVGRSRSDLARRWHATIPKGVTPKVFLDWVILLRAVGQKTRWRSWEAAADELGVNEARLRSAATRLMRRRLTELDAASLAVVRAEFDRVVLIPLGIDAP